MGKQLGPILEGVAFAAAAYFSGGSSVAILGRFALGVAIGEASILLTPKAVRTLPPGQKITVYDTVGSGQMIYGNSVARHRALIHAILSADH